MPPAPVERPAAPRRRHRRHVHRRRPARGRDGPRLDPQGPDDARRPERGVHRRHPRPARGRGPGAPTTSSRSPTRPRSRRTRCSSVAGLGPPCSSRPASRTCSRSDGRSATPCTTSRRTSPSRSSLGRGVTRSIERLDYRGSVLTPLDEGSVVAAVDRLLADGIESVADLPASCLRRRCARTAGRGDRPGSRARYPCVRLERDRTADQGVLASQHDRRQRLRRAGDGPLPRRHRGEAARRGHPRSAPRHGLGRRADDRCRPLVPGRSTSSSPGRRPVSARRSGSPRRSA